MKDNIRVQLSSRDNVFRAELMLTPRETLAIVRRAKAERVRNLLQAAKRDEDTFVTVARDVHESLRELIGCEVVLTHGNLPEKPQVNL